MINTNTLVFISVIAKLQSPCSIFGLTVWPEVTDLSTGMSVRLNKEMESDSVRQF